VQPVVFRPGKAPLRSDKTDQGFDPALMTDLASDKSRKMYFDPKQFPNSLDQLKTDAPMVASGGPSAKSWMNTVFGG
jgi:hypothetical protein